MKFSLQSLLTRFAAAVLLSLVLLSVLGRAAAVTAGGRLCPLGFPCFPERPEDWLKVGHLVAALLTAALMSLTVRQAWRNHRDSLPLLPLATVAGVLFLGQTLVGAVVVARGSPLHLVALHGLTAAGLWVSVGLLFFVSGSSPATERRAARPGQRRRSLLDFVVLAKPIIVLLLLVTTFAGLVAGAGRIPAAGLVVWTLLGGGLAASGSSALNQYIDRDIDRRMQRTSRRPLAQGRLTPAEGLSFGLALCLVSYYVMACFVNLVAALLCLAGIVYYVVVYSLLLKKATVQNIVIGGGAGAIPPMVGWAAGTGGLSLGAWLLFAVVFMWTPAHFWALALVRRRDYARAGVPMLPVVHGEAETRKQILVYTLILVLVSLLVPALGLAGIIYAVGAAALGFALMWAAFRLWKRGGNRLAWAMYRWSSLYLALLFAVLVIDTLA